MSTPRAGSAARRLGHPAEAARVIGQTADAGAGPRSAGSVFVETKVTDEAEDLRERMRAPAESAEQGAVRGLPGGARQKDEDRARSKGR